MALDFPNSPAINQQFPSPPQTGISDWLWDGSAWTSPPLIPKVITVNATGTKLYQGSLVNSQTYNGITIVAGTKLALVVTVNWDRTTLTTPTGLSMVWDSGGTNQSMTRIITSDSGAHSGGASELWGLINPVIGNKTLSMSWTTTCRLFVCSIAFSGVDQTGGATSFPNAVYNASAATLNINSGVGHIAMCVGSGTTALGTILGTTLFSDSASGSFINAYASYIAGAAPYVTLGASASGPIVGTDILPG